MIVSLKKDYVYVAPEGSRTIWDKEIFDIEIFTNNINPSEKLISLNFRFVNKENGLVSYPIGVDSTFSFDRVARERVKNQSEINNLSDKKQRISQLISATENMNSQLENYKNNSGLADDEKLKVDADIDENKVLIEKEKVKFDALIIPEPIIEKSEDYDFVVREYFTGFDLNEKGKKWAEKLVNNTLMFETEANLNSINKNKI